MSDQNMSSVPTLTVDAENETLNSASTSPKKTESAQSSSKPKAPDSSSMASKKRSKKQPKKPKKKRGFFSRLFLKLLLLMLFIGLILAAVFWGMTKFFPEKATLLKESAVAQLPETSLTPKIRSLIGLTPEKQRVSDKSNTADGSASSSDSSASIETHSADSAKSGAGIAESVEKSASLSSESAVTSAVPIVETLPGSGSDSADYAAMSKKITELSEETESLKSLFKGFSSVAGQKQRLQLNEAEYLVKLASQHLSLTKNVPGALGLLESADKVLSETRGIDVIPARKAISASLQTLSDAAYVDTEKLFFKLSELEQLVTQFEFAAVPQAQVVVEQGSINVDTQNTTFLGAVGDIAKGIVGKAVRVREVAEINPLLDSQGQLAAKQNVSLLISQAKIALLQRQGTAFEASLTQAQAYIDNLSSLKNEGMSKASELFKDILSVNITPELPDLSPALSAVNKLVVKAEKNQLFDVPVVESPEAERPELDEVPADDLLDTNVAKASEAPLSEDAADKAEEISEEAAVTEGQVL